MLPTLWDLDHRFRIMDKYEDLIHVLTLSRPPIEEVVPDPRKARDLTPAGERRDRRDGFQILGQICGGVTAVALNDLDGSLKELERAITELKFKGVQLYTDFEGKPLDSPEF